MEDFIKACLTITEQFLSPSKSISEALLFAFSSEDILLLVGLAISVGALLIIINSIIFFSFGQPLPLSMAIDRLWMNFIETPRWLFGLTIGLLIYSFVVLIVNVREVQFFFLLTGFLPTKLVFSIGAYELGKWGAQHKILVLFAFVLSFGFSLILNLFTGIAIFASIALVVITALEICVIVFKRIWSLKPTFPLGIIGGIFILAFIGGILEPEILTIGYKTYNQWFFRLPLFFAQYSFLLGVSLGVFVVEIRRRKNEILTKINTTLNLKNFPAIDKPVNQLPSFIHDALVIHGLMDAFLFRPSYQKKGYVEWILEAKQITTKESRLAQMLDELESQGVYKGRVWFPKHRSKY